MALFTSTNGKFEITALNFSPRIIAWGESATLSYSLKNVSGKTISNFSVTFIVYCQTDDGTSMTCCYSDDDNTTVKSLGAGKTLTVTTGFTALNRPYSTDRDKNPDLSDRLLKDGTYGRLWVGIYPDDGELIDEFYNIYGDNHEYLAIIDKRYSPTVASFITERATNDEDPNIKTTVRLSLADGLTVDQKARMKLSVTCNGATVPHDTDVTIDQLITGIIKSTTFITQQFGKDDDYKLTLTFGDEYETDSRPCTVPRGFANVHLSGDDAGGVCFGGFCDADNPGRFECYYPAYFYGGIYGSGSTQGGVETAVTVSGNSYVDVAVTFTEPYAGDVVPMVLVGFGKDTATTDQYVGRISAYVVNGSVTNKGFTARICSNTSNSYAISLRWLAIAI